jgi:hypothetical protein
MKAADRERLRAVLKSFDEVGLVALANKGLVRRAAKDLRDTTLRVEEKEDALLVHGPDFTVTMPPEGPVKASDDTKATGITRQILMATMFLRDSWAAAEETRPRNEDESHQPDASARDAPPSPPGTLPEPEGGRRAAPDQQSLQAAILALTHEHLQKWAGKNVMREALFLARANPRLEVEMHSGLALRFVDHEVEARILPGTDTSASRLLDAILTTAPKSSHSRWVVATVLALQQHWGKSIEPQSTTILAEKGDSPRTRTEVLDAVRGLLETVVNTGLAHPSERLYERTVTLSISALSVQLPRLGRLLRSLADEVSLLLSRDAKGDTGRLLDRLCLTLALTQATISAGDSIPLALAGWPRTDYEPAGDLGLVGLAAFPWQTASGFRGLTLLLWDEQAKALRSWSTSRSTSTSGRFDLSQAYQTDVVWPGGGAPETLCRSRFVLRAARMNYQGRLSAALGIAVEQCKPAQPRQLDFAAITFRSWAKLGEHLRQLFPLGLRESQPLDSYAILYPSRWGPCVFNELMQQLSWTIADDVGNSLSLSLPWAPIHENAIEFLEQVRPDRDRLTAVVARLAFEPSGPSVEPVAIWSEGTPGGDYVLNPAFDLSRIQSKHFTMLDRLRQKYGRNVLSTTMQSEDEEPDWLLPAAQFPPELEKRFSDLEGLLSMWAERGTHRSSDTDSARLRSIAHRLAQAGLDWLSGNLAALESSGSGLMLLWCVYLLRTYRQAQMREQLGQQMLHAGLP